MTVKRFSKYLILIAAFVLMAPQFAQAALPAELERQIAEAKRERDILVEEQRKLQAELEIVMQESRSLSTAVKSLDSTRSKLATDIRLTQSKISSANLSIRALETTSADKERQIAAHRKAIATTLQELSKHDSRSLVADILAYGQLSDVWGDRASLANLNITLNEEINALRDARMLLEREKQEKEKTKVALSSLEDQLGGQKRVVEENKAAKARLLAETKSREAEYQQLLKDNLERQKMFEAELFRFESELRIALDPSLYPTSQRGLLSWPLDYVYVTQRFGHTSGSARLYASGTHNGVDFRAAMGTPVKSVLSGVVEGQGNTDSQKGCYSYGRWILIRHNNGLSTVYSHLSGTVVQTGQVVETGQVIGYSGGTPGVYGSGYSTGPHLHLGLFASQGVEVRQFTQSIGCKQVHVPIADPKAYLDPLAYLP